MHGFFLAKSLCSIGVLFMWSYCVGVLALPEVCALKSAINYALASHPSVVHANLDLDQIRYDLTVEKQKFVPKLFWHSEAFYEKDTYYDNQGFSLGPLMHWEWVTGTKIRGNLGTELGKNHQDLSRVGFFIKQPLIKNTSKQVNQSGIIQATIQKDILLLNYDFAVEDVILQVSTHYFNYAQMVLAKHRQHSGLEQAKKYLNQVNSLIDIGRLPKNEAEQPALYVETQESLLEESKQRLAFNYLMLLKSIGVITDSLSNNITISTQTEEYLKEEIENLLISFKTHYFKTMSQDFLPIDKQEKIFINQKKIIDQNQYVAKDNTKWDMNLEGYASMRQKENQYGVTLSLDFPINDQLRRYQSLYHLQIEKDKLKDEKTLHEYYYPKKIAFERQEIESKFKQLDLTVKMRNLAQKSLQTAELKWQVGRLTLFELIQLSNQYQQSELDLIKAKINILNTGFAYFKTIGLLKQFWVEPYDKI